MPICTTQYFDKNNNLSLEYYNNLHLGHEAALNIYLKSMQHEPIIRFQKHSIDDVLAKSKEIQNRKEKPKNYLSGSMMVDAFRSEKLEDKLEPIAKESVTKEIAKEMFLEARNPFNYNAVTHAQLRVKHFNENKFVTIPDDIIGEVISTVEGLKADEIEKGTKALIKSWSQRAGFGTDFHKHLENYFNKRNEILATVDLDFNVSKDGTFDPKILRKFITEPITNEQKRKDVENVLTYIEDWIKQSKIKVKRISTEVSVSDDVNETGGTLDLVITDVNDVDHLVDYKFKEKGKANFYTSRLLGNLEGPYADLPNNRYTENSLQLSTYRFVLNDTYGRKVGSSTILYFEGEISKNGLTYSKITKPIPYQAANYRTNVIRALEKRGRKIIKEKVKQPGTFQGLKDVIENLSGQENFYIIKNKDERARTHLSRGKFFDEKEGKSYFINRTKPKQKEWFYSEERDEQIKQLKDYYELLEKDLSSSTQDIIAYHNSPNRIWPNSHQPHKQVQANSLLFAINEDFKLTQVQNLAGFEDVAPNIVFAFNDKTNEGFVFSVGNQKDHLFFLDNKDKNRTNMFNELIDDKNLRTKFRLNSSDDLHALAATSTNYQMLDNAMIALKLQKQGYMGTVKGVSHGIIDGIKGREVPRYEDLSFVVDQLKMLNTLIKDKEDYKNPLLLEEFQLVEAYKPKSLMTNHVDTLMSQFDRIEKLVHISNFSDTTKINSLYDLYKKNNKNKKFLIKELVLVLNNLTEKLQNGNLTRNDLVKNAEVEMLARAIVELAGIELDSSSFNKRFLLNKNQKSLVSFGNKMIQQIIMLDQATQQNVTQQINDFKTEHNKLIEALIKEKGLNIIDEKTTKDLYKIYENLFIVNPNKATDDYTDAFKLKDSSDKSLKKAEREYIDFFNKNILKGFKSTLTEDQYKKVEEGKEWQKGLVPLQNASTDNKISREESFSGKVKLSKESVLTKNYKKTAKTLKDVYWKIDNAYENQVGSDIMQQHTSRQRMLGIDENGKKISEAQMLETNLGTILTKFYTESMKDHYYNDTLGIINSLQILLIAEETNLFKDTAEIRGYIDDMVQLQIMNTYKDEGRGGKLADNIRNLTNIGTMAVNIKQPIQEFAQGFFASRSILLGNRISKAFGLKMDFKNESWYAANLYSGFGMPKDINSAINQKRAILGANICNALGVHNGDMHLINNDDSRTIFKSSNLFWMNAYWGKDYRAHYIFTKLIDEGIMPAYDMNNGKLAYDPTKDKRFEGIFDENKKLKDNLVDQKLLDRKLLYEAIATDMQEEYNGINEETGLISKPLTSRELVVLKNKVARAYGTIEREGKVNAQAASLWRMFFTYKGWIPIKLDNYWTKNTEMELRGSYVKVADKNNPGQFLYEFRPSMGEGIIQTLNFIQRQARSEMKEIGRAKGLVKVFKDLEPYRQENLRKLMADLIVLAIGWTSVAVLSNTELFKGKTGKYLLATTMGSINDLNIIATSDYMFSSSPFASYKYITSTVKNVKNIVQYSATGDLEKVKASTIKLSGMTKAIDNLVLE